MIKMLFYSLLFICVFTTNSARAQEFFLNNSSLLPMDISFTNLKSKVDLEKNVFSYTLEEDSIFSTHLLHEDHEVVEIDFFSFDKGADFNCSGGFCMDKLHIHKKGLTMKKQLFGYFIRISC